MNISKENDGILIDISSEMKNQIDKNSHSIGEILYNENILTGNVELNSVNIKNNKESIQKLITLEEEDKENFELKFKQLAAFSFVEFVLIVVLGLFIILF